MFRGAERKRFMYRWIFLAVIGQCDFCPPYTGLNTYYSFDHFHFLLIYFPKGFHWKMYKNNYALFMFSSGRDCKNFGEKL